MPTTLLGEQVDDGPAGCGEKAFTMAVAALEKAYERDSLATWSLDRASYI